MRWGGGHRRRRKSGIYRECCRKVKAGKKRRSGGVMSNTSKIGANESRKNRDVGGGAKVKENMETMTAEERKREAEKQKSLENKVG